MKKLSFVMTLIFLMVFIGSNELERNNEIDKGAKISLTSAKADPGDWCSPMPWMQCSLAGNIYMHYKLWKNPNPGDDVIN